MDRNWLSTLRKLTQVFTVLVVTVSMLSCTGEPQKPADIQGDGYAYAKEWVTWYITNNLIKNGNVPSVVIALVDDQEVVWQEAFGYANLEEEIFTSADTVYRVASVSKPFTGLAIMKLYEEGVIDIDTPITDYLPEFSIKTRFSDSDPITIRSIMGQRAGLPSSGVRIEGEIQLESYERMSLEDIVTSVKDEYVAYPVGHRFKYQNLGFSLIGRIIEVVTGSEFVDYMQENILNSIGMSDSSFLSSPEILGKMATAYHISQDKIEHPPQNDLSDLPAGNLYTTLNDMTKSLKFLFRDGEADGDQLIKKETLEMMYGDYYSRPRDPTIHGLPYNLSLLSTGHIMVDQEGSLPGFSSNLGFLPNEKLGFIIMANTNTFLNVFGVKIIELMLETKLGIKPVEEKIPEAIDVDKSILEKYVGKYSMGSPIEVVLNNNMLQLVLPPSPNVPIKGKINLIPISETKFRLPSLVSALLEKVMGLKIALEFFVGDESEEDIIVAEDKYSSIWNTFPKIPEVEEIPALWEELSGKYTVEPYFKEEIIGEMEVNIVDNVLTFSMKLNKGGSTITELPLVLNPISNTEILIVGDLYFDGETMFYDSNTGYLQWSGMVFKPIEEGE